MARPLAGRRDVVACSATPVGVVGEGVGRCTSVTASRMTDAYGASTR
ncbi:hypothetical protein [Porphyromonas bennonis]|nr:hypothetical protein [Porphyromonas bennonis]